MPALVPALFIGAGVLAAGVGIALRRRAARRTRRVLQAITHDLRTPLATIQSSSELLLRGNGVGAEQGRWLQVITRETQQLTGRIENLIVFAWARRGELLVLRAPLDFSDLVGRTVAAMTPAAEARGATIRCAIPDGLAVRGDASRLGQAIANVLDNAIRFGPSGQSIRVTVEANHGRVHLSIHDEGPGIPANERRRVWRPFARHGGPTPPAAETGTGLGLAVTRAIIAAHGGRATFDTAGGGTTVRISLPRLHSTSSDASQPEPSTSAGD